MSEPKRANIITVAGAKRSKNNVTKTVRLCIDLCESNENKYPELNYKELVKAEEKKNKEKVENGKKPQGLDPYSDNDDDIEKVARKFEQKYGSHSTYGKRCKKDEFADIGAGYDENDSFIDNTDGYDEMVPPAIDTYHGGFYINCGSLEFKSVPDNQLSHSDTENIGTGHRGNKRRISSSSSEEESSDSSSDSESQNEEPIEKNTDGVAINGDIDSHKTDERRKKKKKKSSKKKAKRIRREGSSAATSGKHTSDDNGQVDGESADSRTSQSDSLTSKPAPSSENAVTSDSSRDVSDAKEDTKIPSSVKVVLQELATAVDKLKQNNPAITAKELEHNVDATILKLERALGACGAEVRCRRSTWAKAAKSLGCSRTRLLQRARALNATKAASIEQATDLPPPSTSAPATTLSSTSNVIEKPAQKDSDNADVDMLDPQETEKQITQTLERLKALIEERKPSMISSYRSECERIQEENKKIAETNATVGATRQAERRLPKRRFPWCQRARALLSRLTRLAGGPTPAAQLLASRALPLFPSGFVRLPTLLRQANLNKEVNINQIKKPKQHIPTPPVHVPDIQLPSAISVTTTTKTTPEKTHNEVACSTRDEVKENGKNSDQNPFSQKSLSLFGYNLAANTDVFLEKQEKTASTEKPKISTEKSSTKPTEPDKYVPPNNIGSITITPVVNNAKFDPRHQASKLANNTVSISSGEQKNQPLIRVKSPAALIKAANDIANKEKQSKSSKNVDPKPKSIIPEKRTHSPLRIDTAMQPHRKIDSLTKSPNNISPNLIRNDKTTESNKKVVDTLKVSENNIPRPGLIPVHHSPTFAKPAEKRSEPKKPKKDNVTIVSELDPLGDVLQVDDSSSDIELIEEVPNDPLIISNLTKPKEPSKEDKKKSEEVRKDRKDSDRNPEVRKELKTVESIRKDVNFSEVSRKERKEEPTSSEVNRKDRKEEPKSTDIRREPKDPVKHADVNRKERKDDPKSSEVKRKERKEEVRSAESTKEDKKTEVKRKEDCKRMDADDGAIDIDKVMRDLREMQNSQEPHFTSSDIANVLKTAQNQDL